MSNEDIGRGSFFKMELPNILIIAGIALILAGLLWQFGSKLGLGSLPGDIKIEKENFRFYFPLTTSILISIVLSLLFLLYNFFSHKF